jgi:intein/homing endonuclease
VSTDNNLDFIELDVEDTDTYIIKGSTAFNAVVSHNSPCFVMGTQILLENGLTKNIEDVVVGDYVVSFDLKNNEPKVSKVLNTFSKTIDKVVEYEFSNGSTLKATLDHPIYVNNKGWVNYSGEPEEYNNVSTEGTKPVRKLEVQKIEIGDVVKLHNGDVELVKMNVIEESTIVYNLSEIETYHNYFANNVLVHNLRPVTCFITGTEITLSNGDVKNIEDVIVGEGVLTYNEVSGEQEVGVVGNLKQHEVHSVIKLIFDNEVVITTTSEHPFFVDSKGWVKAGNLELHDVCKKVNGDTSILTSIEVLEESHVVYNLLSVSENHNFYANGILVHNK